MVKAGEADIALTVEVPDVSDPEISGLDRTFLLDDPMYAALPAGHRLAQSTPRAARGPRRRVVDPRIDDDDLPGRADRDAGLHARRVRPRHRLQQRRLQRDPGLRRDRRRHLADPDLACINVRDDVVVRSLGASPPVRRICAVTVVGLVVLAGARGDARGARRRRPRVGRRAAHAAARELSRDRNAPGREHGGALCWNAARDRAPAHLVPGRPRDRRRGLLVPRRPRGEHPLLRPVHDRPRGRALLHADGVRARARTTRARRSSRLRAEIAERFAMDWRARLPATSASASRCSSRARSTACSTCCGAGAAASSTATSGSSISNHEVAASRRRRLRRAVRARAGDARDQAAGRGADARAARPGAST